MAGGGLTGIEPATELAGGELRGRRPRAVRSSSPIPAFRLLKRGLVPVSLFRLTAG